MDGRPRRPNWEDQKELQWSSWRFGMPMDAIRTVVHDQTNISDITTLGFRPYMNHVKEVTYTIDEKTEKALVQALKPRIENEHKQYNKALDAICRAVIQGDSIFPRHTLDPFIDFSQQHSVDNLVHFFYACLDEQGKQDVDEELGSLCSNTFKANLSWQEPAVMNVPDNFTPPESPPSALESPPRPKVQAKSTQTSGVRKRKATRPCTGTKSLRYNLRKRTVGIPDVQADLLAKSDVISDG